MSQLTPSVNGSVLYVSEGTRVRADGSQKFPSVFRAATITELIRTTPAASGSVVLNPAGIYFHPLADDGCPYDPHRDDWRLVALAGADVTGGLALEAVAAWGGALTVAAGIITAVWRAIRAMARTAHRAEEFLDDWYGQPARPGVPSRPGLMERVDGIEARLGRVEHELHPNEGASLRDAVDRTNRSLGRLCPECSDPEHQPPAAT